MQSVGLAMQSFYVISTIYNLISLWPKLTKKFAEKLIMIMRLETDSAHMVHSGGVKPPWF